MKKGIVNMEQVNIIRITPEQFGYKDRGIVKWQGMILADQTEALKQIKNEVTEIPPKEEMSEEEISQVLYQAFTNKLPVAIQANALRRDGNYYKDLECKVSGYADNQIHLRLKDGRTTSCTLEQIRNVEMIDPLDWYDKRK